MFTQTYGSDINGGLDQETNERTLDLTQSRKPVVLDFTRHTLWISLSLDTAHIGSKHGQQMVMGSGSRDLDLLKLDTDRQTRETEERGF